MAKKIRKRRTSPANLFVKLLIPWVAMGAIAYSMFSMGFSDLETYGTALAGALAVTFMIRILDRKRTLDPNRQS